MGRPLLYTAAALGGRYWNTTPIAGRDWPAWMQCNRDRTASMSNTTETAALDMFCGHRPSYRAGATQYLALFTADPGEIASLAAEAIYTVRAGGADQGVRMDGTASPFTNTALIQFGLYRRHFHITHFAVVDTSSGAVNMISGALSSTLSVSSGIQPQFAAGALECVGRVMFKNFRASGRPSTPGKYWISSFRGCPLQLPP